MSTGITSVPSSATKTPKRRSKAKKSGPTVSELILKVLSASKERGGVSLVALKKALAASGYDVARNNFRIKLTVKRLVAKGGLTQTKGTGASGSFKISTKAVTKPKKPKAKKAKRKNAGTKKTPKKSRRNVKSREQASETEAKKTKRPKRAKRRAAKTTKAKTAKK